MWAVSEPVGPRSNDNNFNVKSARLACYIDGRACDRNDVITIRNCGELPCGRPAVKYRTVPLIIRSFLSFLLVHYVFPLFFISPLILCLAEEINNRPYTYPLINIQLDEKSRRISKRSLQRNLTWTSLNVVFHSILLYLFVRCNADLSLKSETRSFDRYFECF